MYIAKHKRFEIWYFQFVAVPLFQLKNMENFSARRERGHARAPAHSIPNCFQMVCNEFGNGLWATSSMYSTLMTQDTCKRRAYPHSIRRPDHRICSIGNFPLPYLPIFRQSVSYLLTHWPDKFDGNMAFSENIIS